MHRHDAVQKYRKASPEANPDPEVARARFFGEPPAVATVQVMAHSVRGISAYLMGLDRETWADIRRSPSLESLITAAGELKTTVAAIGLEDDPLAGTCAAPFCPVATVHDVLRDYRRRLHFVASNIPLSDPHSRGLLRELLDFDRWLGSHLERCPACQVREV